MSEGDLLVLPQARYVACHMLEVHLDSGVGRFQLDDYFVLCFFKIFLIVHNLVVSYLLFPWH